MGQLVRGCAPHPLFGKVTTKCDLQRMVDCYKGSVSPGVCETPLHVFFITCLFVLHETTPIVIGGHTCKCPNKTVCVHLLQVARARLHEAGQFSIWYRCSTVSRLLIRRTINSCGWIFVDADASVCVNNYTQQHIKTDYESTKNKNNNKQQLQLYPCT